MIDLAKVADLVSMSYQTLYVVKTALSVDTEFFSLHQVLMLIDASFGFEMETFEFLNICQVHGFPRVMGVLTHLDSFKNNKSLNKTKKRLKHRFWTEVYQVKATYSSEIIHFNDLKPYQDQCSTIR